MMPKKYEVAFVVYADIPEKDSSIGDLECNGTLRSYNCYSLRDARMYFTISAETPEEAYKKGLEKMQFGDADDEILCPECGYSLARNDEKEELRPKHCPECGTKLIY